MTTVFRGIVVPSQDAATKLSDYVQNYMAMRRDAGLNCSVSVAGALDPDTGKGMLIVYSEREHTDVIDDVCDVMLEQTAIDAVNGDVNEVPEEYLQGLSARRRKNAGHEIVSERFDHPQIMRPDGTTEDA
jgi:hypothetical protein